MLTLLYLFDKHLAELANIYLLKVTKVTPGQGVKSAQDVLKRH